MTFEAWIAFTAANAVLLVIPGPTILLVISYALGQGWRTALPMAIGVALGDFTAMTLSLFGVGALPDGKRKDNLAAALDGVMDLFDSRILPFDASAARRYADLAVKARMVGKGFPTPDGYIAAIAAAHEFAVASRDTSAFRAAGLTVINPWITTQD